jgi:hypothetical protein
MSSTPKTPPNEQASNHINNNSNNNNTNTVDLTVTTPKRKRAIEYIEDDLLDIDEQINMLKKSIFFFVLYLFIYLITYTYLIYRKKNFRK